MVDESSFVSAVSLVAEAVGDDDADGFRFADRSESSSSDSDAGGGSDPVGDGCEATAAMAAARIGLPPLRGENTRAAAAAIRASLDWRSWIAISWGTMALPSPSPLSGGRAGGGGSFILVPLLHRLSGSEDRVGFGWPWEFYLWLSRIRGRDHGPATRLSACHLFSSKTLLLKNHSMVVGHNDVVEKLARSHRQNSFKIQQPRTESIGGHGDTNRALSVVAQQIPAVKRLVDDRL